jgi:hypothetical protein
MVASPVVSVVYSVPVNIPALLATSQLIILLPCLHHALNTCHYVASEVKPRARVHIYYVHASLE